MLLEKNKAIIRKMVEVSNKRNLAMIDEFMALDFLVGSNPTGLAQKKHYDHRELAFTLKE
jgi:hypothetical protein